MLCVWTAGTFFAGVPSRGGSIGSEPKLTEVWPMDHKGQIEEDPWRLQVGRGKTWKDWMREGVSDRNTNVSAASKHHADQVPTKQHVDQGLEPQLLKQTGKGKTGASIDKPNNEPGREGQSGSTDRDKGILDTSLSLNLGQKAALVIDLNLTPQEESSPILNQGKLTKNKEIHLRINSMENVFHAGSFDVVPMTFLPSHLAPPLSIGRGDSGTGVLSVIQAMPGRNMRYHWGSINR